MIPTVIQDVLVVCALLLIFAWVVWRRYLAANPLDNIPGPPNHSWLTGNLRQVVHPYGWDFNQLLADRYGSIVKIRTLFGVSKHRMRDPLIVSDPTALHHILVKDDTHRLLFGNGLLSSFGERHRKQRKMLNPLFSISHLTDMAPMFKEVSTTLRDAIAAQVQDRPRDINMLDWFSRTAFDIVGQTGLGYSFDSLKEGLVSPYTKAVKNLIPALVKTAMARQLLPYAIKIGSPKFHRYVAEITPWKAVHEILDSVDMMYKTSVEVFKMKKKALLLGDEAVLQQVGRGKDITSILLKANMAASEEDRLPDDELIAQMTTLVFAAMETTSGALARTFLSLAQHPEAQDRLREELKQAKADKGDLSYDDLVSLPYLDAVCRETLRLYPPATHVTRTARKDILLPFSTPVKGVDGTEMRDVLIPKETGVLISIIAANRSREIWGEDASEWKPERWLKPLPLSVTAAHVPSVYSHIMTFLGGGRACLGFKYAELEMKIVLSVMLESFRFKPSHEIVWTIFFSVPRIKDSKDETSQLPLSVELIDGEGN
ncbi:cytochrome P450 [Melanogaster broomeanus]|nr:cytochrome P450 [Melanogaster broomeanus]